MTQEALKLALDALQFALHVGFDESSESQIKKGDKAGQQHRKTIAAIKLAEHAMREVQRLGQEIEPDDLASILVCRDMLDAQPVPPRTWVGSGDLEDSNAYLTPPQRTEQVPAPGYCKHCKQYTIEEPLPSQRTEQEPVAVYGYCPQCGAKGVMRERRPNGNDKCANGHTYPSSTSTPPQRKPLTDEAQVLRILLGAALGALRYHTEQTRPIQRTNETIAAIEHELAAHGIKENT